MKLCWLNITIFLVMINILIPSSFKEMSSFSSDISVSLTDFVESSKDCNDGEKEDETLDEVENELILSDKAAKLFSHSSLHEITYSLKTFISSYIFSIFIPPLA